MGLPAVVGDEHRRLRDGRKQENHCVQERLLELGVGRHVLIRLREILEAYFVQGVVIAEDEYDDLPEEGNGEPDAEYGVRGPDVGDFFNWLHIGEEVQIDGGQNAQHHCLTLRIL